MTNTNENKTIFNVDDIIEVSMNIDYQIPEGEEEKPVFDASDYDTKYEIHFSCPQKDWIMFTDFTVEAGYIATFDDNIINYLEESLENNLEEIAEYELFDVEDKGLYQTAKIKITALK